jgi:hypothetical protein
MHRRGIASALLVALRHVALGLITLVGVTLAAGLARADVTYDYTGSAFTDNVCAPPPCSSPLTDVTGSFVFANPLRPSAIVGEPISFSISDGPDTITQASGTPYLDEFGTNSSGNISSALFGVTNNNATIGITPSGDAANDYLGGKLNTASNSTPGTWTLVGTGGTGGSGGTGGTGGAGGSGGSGGSPGKGGGGGSGGGGSKTPVFNLQFKTVPNGGNSGLIVLATAKDTTGPISLSTAAQELTATNKTDVDHFNWVQIVIANPGLTACAGTHYPNGSAACNRLTNEHGEVPALGTTDPPPGGWRYQDPTFSQHGQNPFYWDETSANQSTYYQEFQTPATDINVPINDLLSPASLTDAYGFLFDDAPKFNPFPGTDIFVDDLVGVSGDCVGGATCRLVPTNTAFFWTDTNGKISVNGGNADLISDFTSGTVLGPSGGSSDNITVQPISLDQFLTDSGYTLTSFEALAGSPVPEPSTWAMMLLGFVGLGYAGYRSTRRTTAAA